MILKNQSKQNENTFFLNQNKIKRFDVKMLFEIQKVKNKHMTLKTLSLIKHMILYLVYNIKWYQFSITKCTCNV